MARPTKERIQRAHVQLMRSKQFCLLSGVIMCGNVRIEPDFPTAATDGWNVVYGDKFCQSINEKVLAWAVAHENFHKLLKHMTVWKKLFVENAQLANMAADYVINLLIEDADPAHKVVEPWEHALLDARFRGMSTQQVYDILKKESQGQGQGQGQGQAFDEHMIPQEGEVTAEEARQRADAIDAAIRQGGMLAGKMGANVERLVSELTTPKVDWRAVLREFVTSTANERENSTWRRPNRRHIHSGMYLPSYYSEAVGDIVVAIDTSGSIDDTTISAFAAELVSICETVSPSKVHLLWWGTAVVGHQEFTKADYADMAKQLKPRGGGGTDVGCVFEYLTQARIKPECVVVLTDGYTPWPSPPSVPVLFAINTGVVAPWGVTVDISGE